MKKQAVELWTTLGESNKSAAAITARAVRLEADGWNGATLTDSQCLRGDVFVNLASCAIATTTLKLGTGTSNPATRHPAVLASAAAAMQEISDGRMSLSIGRGDSALAYIGLPPVSVAFFERAVAMIQTYLKGSSISLEEAASMLPGLSKGFDHLAMASAPEASRLTWLPEDMVKPELDVAATGPKVIAVAARHADCISFTLGTNIERLKWGIELAREEVAKAGRDPAEVRLCAYFPLYPHSDVEVARHLVKGMVASHGRFSIMNKRVVVPVSDKQRKQLEQVAGSYEMAKHGRSEGKQADAVDAEFIDDFALVGDPARCVDRLHEIIELGLDRLTLWTGSADGEASESYQMAVRNVLPHVLNKALT